MNISSSETKNTALAAPSTLKNVDGNANHEQESPRPQLSFRSNDEEILREVCLNNGINFKKLYLEGPMTTVLEMFFSGYPRLIGMHHFPNLTTLTVIGQSVSRLEGLNDLVVLDELWVAECQLKKIEGLEQCKALTKLYLYGNRISEIQNIQHLHNLKILWLNNNLIKIIENLETLLKLKELNIAENLIEKIGNSLSQNMNLEELNLSGNPLLSLRDLTCLVKLHKLTRLSLKDPLYPPSPASQLCNYSTHILFHLPKLISLDTIDMNTKHLTELAEGTVNKKKMFYNMRSKTICRNMADFLARLESASKELLETPHSKLRILNFVIREMYREIELKHVTVQPDKERFPIQAKLQRLEARRQLWEEKAIEIESFVRLSEARVRKMADMMIKRLLVELETGGNVRFEDGQPSDTWFTCCHDLVLSRFCAYDYRNLGVTGIKIHRIIRIHNRMLRTRFDRSIAALTDTTKGEYYPGVKNIAYKKSLEYLFSVTDPEMDGSVHGNHRIPEEGFMDAQTYKELNREAAVPLSNSISLADRQRIAYCKDRYNKESTVDDCPYRYGQLIVAKAHLGKSVVAVDNVPISKGNYPKMDSVFKPWKKCLPKEKKHEPDGCDCSTRQCEWYIFDNSLVLPEYIIDFEYITKVRNPCPFQHFHDDLLSEQPQRHKLSVSKTWEQEDIDTDNEIIKMEPEIKSRPRMTVLQNEVVLALSQCDSLDNVTELNLHGNGLERLTELQSLRHLKKLVVSFNELTRLDDLANMPLVSLDASYNKIYTLDGLKCLYQLTKLNVSWNNLVNTREELSILRKHLHTLQNLDLRNNPWLKAKDLRLRAIGRLRNLKKLDGKPVEEEESALALRCAAGSRISQLSLLTYARTDQAVPRSLSLGDAAQVITATSRSRPQKNGDNDTRWYSQVTTLNLDNQHITKLSNLDKLEHLMWASFNNNDLTRIEGLDCCTNLLELSLTNNCIAHLDGLSNLTHLERLDISHNCLTSIDNGVLGAMPSLTSLSLESNQLNSLAGLQRCMALTELYIGNNNINNIREVFLLKPLPNLVILDMYGNPMVTSVENYRLFVIYHLRSLKALDGSAIEVQEGSLAKDTFGGRLTIDYVAEKLGHASFSEIRELDLPNNAIRVVDLGSGDLFINLRSVNLEHNNLQSFAGLIHLVNLRVLCLNYNHIECILPRAKVVTQTNKKNMSVLGKNMDNSVQNSSPVLQHLEVLHLGYNGIKDLTALQLNLLPSLKALFLQGNEIVKVEGLDGVHDLRELVLDKNKIKQISETAFVNQWNLQELHVEENRLKEISGLSTLENLMRLYIGSNRISDQTELEKLDPLRNLCEISLANNPVARRMIHRIILIHRLPRLLVIDGIPVSEDERNKAELYFMDQTLSVTPPQNQMETSLPGIVNYKPSIQVKVTNMQLNSGTWGNSNYADDDIVLRGGPRVKRQTQSRDVRQNFGLSGTNLISQANNSNSRMQYMYLNQANYNGSQASELMENMSRINQQRNSKR